MLAGGGADELGGVYCSWRRKRCGCVLLLFLLLLFVVSVHPPQHGPGRCQREEEEEAAEAEAPSHQGGHCFVVLWWVGVGVGWVDGVM